MRRFGEFEVWTVFSVEEWTSLIESCATRSFLLKEPAFPKRTFVKGQNKPKINTFASLYFRFLSQCTQMPTQLVNHWRGRAMRLARNDWRCVVYCMYGPVIRYSETRSACPSLSDSLLPRSFKSALKTRLFSSGLWMAFLCGCSCVPLFRVCVCVCVCCDADLALYCSLQARSR